MIRSEQLIRLATDPRALAGLLRWPVFSFTSYDIASRLRTSGVTIGTLLDVGANIGQFAITCAKLFPGIDVISFEPHPGAFQRLAGLAPAVPNFTAWNVAVGEKPGVAELRVNTHSHSSSLLPLKARHKQAFPDARENGTAKVKVVTLDEALAGRTLRPPVFLKLDVQGYESKVLAGAARLLETVDWLMMESSVTALYEGESGLVEMIAIAESRGFAIASVLDALEDPYTEEILQMDLLFRRCGEADTARRKLIGSSNEDPVPTHLLPA
jgi:FkbM family methyltransferase